MAVSGVVEFHASSGSPAGTAGGFQLDPFVAGSGTEWNRMGFFGSSGPGSFVTVNQYQDKTYACNESGVAPDSTINTASGELTNNKFVNSTSVNPNASGSVALSTLTEIDATIRVQFTEPSGNAVETQNAELKCVQFGATSGVANEDAVPTGVTVQAAEVGQDTSWEKISDDAADNSISLTSRATASIVHDYHLAISVSPISTGEIIDFGFLFKLEYI